MTNVLILEDNPEVAEAIKTVILRIDKNAEVHIETTAAGGYKTALESSVSLFLIDIILDKNKKGDVSGLHFASAIRRLPDYKFTDMIFLSALIDEKFYAYSQLHCYSYFEKPFDIRIMEEMIRDLIRHQYLKIGSGRRKEETFFIRSDGIFYPIKEDEIIYIEFHSRHSLIVTPEATYKVHKNEILDSLQKLDKRKFVTSSRFEMVNMDYVEYIDFRVGIMKLKDINKIIKIGQNWRKNIRHAMNS